MRDLILLHGALGSASSLAQLKIELDEKFNCHSFNLGGHGKSPFNKSGFGIEVFAEELGEFILDKGLNNPNIFGYSMGGYVALYLASKQSVSLGKIITLGTKFAWTKESAAHETSRMIPETMEQKIPAYTKKLALTHGSEWKSLVLNTAQMMKGLGEAPLLTSKTLKTIKNEVLILRGSEDKMVTEEESIWASSQLTNGSFNVLDNQPHPIEKVSTSLLTQEILNFL